MIAFHPLKNEGMEAVTGPGIITAKGLENNQGLLQLYRQFNGPLKREI